MSEPPAKRTRALWPKRWAKMTPFSLYWAARQRLFSIIPARWCPDEAMELARRAGDRGNEAGRYLYLTLSAGRLPKTVDELFVMVDQDANEGNVWGMFFSGLLCGRFHEHTIDSAKVDGVCPLLVKAAEAGNVDAMGEAVNCPFQRMATGDGLVPQWRRQALARKHPVAMFCVGWTHTQYQHIAAEQGYYESLLALAHDANNPLTRLRYIAKAIEQFDLMDDTFMKKAKKLINRTYVEKFAKGDRSHDVLRDLAVIGSIIKPWLDELFQGKVFANLVVRLYDKWCFRARRTTLYWMWLWKKEVLGDCFPREIAMIIGRLIWESRFDPICGWERHDIW
jgi:hypothetical protein